MKISAEKGKQNKIHIHCDGEYRFTVDAEYWFSSPYFSKDSIDDEQELAAFTEAVGSRCAFIAGLRLLSYHDSSKKQLSQKLIQKGHKQAYVSNALDRLEELSYVNDERFAQNLAKELSERKGMSNRGIKSELFRHGIDSEIAEIVIEGLDNDPILRIIEIINKKYFRNLSDEKGVRKTVAALQRLGYSWSDIKSALRQIEIDTEVNEDV